MNNPNLSPITRWAIILFSIEWIIWRNNFSALFNVWMNNPNLSPRAKQGCFAWEFDLWSDTLTGTNFVITLFQKLYEMTKMVPVKVYYFFSSNFVIILFQKLYKMTKLVPVKVYYFFSSNFVIILFQKLYKMTKLVLVKVYYLLGFSSLSLSTCLWETKIPEKVLAYSMGNAIGHGPVWVLRCNWGQKEKYKLYLTCQTPLSKHLST